MKTFLRNTLHVIVGALFGWLLFQTFDGVPFGVQLFLTAFVIGGLSIFWEVGWHLYNKSVVDYWDAVRGIIGGLIVVITLNLI